MKLLLQKCGICGHWFKPLAHRQHCPVCCAVKLMSGVYINIHTNKVLTTGIKKLSVNQNRQLQIARILSEEV